MDIILRALFLAVAAGHDGETLGLLRHKVNSVQRRIIVRGALEQLGKRSAETQAHEGYRFVGLGGKYLAVQRHRLCILGSSFGEILLTGGIIHIVGKLLDRSMAHCHRNFRMSVICTYSIGKCSCCSTILVAAYGK